MIKVYTGKLYDYAYLPILYPNLGVQERERGIFMGKVFQNFTSPVFELVKDPSLADFFLFPHDYFLTPNQPAQALKLADDAKSYGKKIIIFGHGDPDCEIPIKNSIVFRTSQYRYKKQANEIMMPAYVEDLSDSVGPQLRHKITKPVIGFCGWADFKSNLEKTSFYTKHYLGNLNNFLSGRPVAVRRRGLWFRQKAINILRRSDKIKANFIIRKSFSGHRATLKDSPEKLRKEYIDNMINSDFVLTVKGYGNFSLRFYEALSLGRIPLFLDTDCVLPLEGIINYRDFTLSVDYRDLNKIDKITADFYENMTEEQFREMQKKARDAFEKYLRIDKFFARIPEILSKF